MNKIIYFLFFTFYFLLSCSDPITIEDYIQEENPYQGFWEIHISEMLNGDATIIVQSNGKIDNGIPIIFYDSLSVLFYDSLSIDTFLNGMVDKNGNFNSSFSNYYKKDSTEIISKGNVQAKFNMSNITISTVSGIWNLTVNDTVFYSGLLYGNKID